MRVCKSLSEMRNLQYRVTCPQQTGGPSNRRVAPFMSRMDEAEQRSEQSLRNGSYKQSALRFDFSDMFSDSSGKSLESSHLTVDESERLGESLMECSIDEEAPTTATSRPIAITPGQLSLVFGGRGESPMMRNQVARSVPVPVPKQGFGGQEVPVCLNDSEKFIPPHMISYRGEDPMKERSVGYRGMASLRARNLVFSQLGYFNDGGAGRQVEF